jgi:hypothetical protein
MTSIRLTLIGLICLAITRPSISQQANPIYPVTDGTVNAMVQSGNTIYLGGNFSYVGPNIPFGAALNAASGAPNTAYARLDGDVEVSIPDGSGGFYIGGRFTKVGSTTRNYLAHLNANGTLDMNFNANANGVVYSLAISGSTLYVGGSSAL